MLIRFLSSTSAAWNLTIVQLSGTASAFATYSGPTITYNPSVVGTHWLDMGVFRFPFAAPPLNSPIETVYTSPGVSFALVVDHTDTSTFDVDCFMLLPVNLDQSTSQTYDSIGIDKSLPGTSYQLVLNSPSDVRYLLDTAGNYSPGIPPAPSGYLPVVNPGEDNSISFLQHLGMGYNDPRTGSNVSTADVLANSTAFSWSYYPRYLFVRPATT